MVLNPLNTSLYRKGQSLRKAKTGKSDAQFITIMLVTEGLKPFTPLSYYIRELKSLTRHYFQLVRERIRFKISYSRILNIIFPELHSVVWNTSKNQFYSRYQSCPTQRQLAIVISLVWQPFWRKILMAVTIVIKLLKSLS